MGRFFIAGLILSLFIAANFPAYANIQDDMRARLPIGQVLGNALGDSPSPAQIKDAVAAIIRDGGDTKQVVRIALGSGFDAEAVISGAIAGGGSLTGIFQAGLDAGLTSDFISGAASRAGASQEAILSAMATANAGEDLYTYEAGRSSGMSAASFSYSIPAGGAGGGGGGNVSNNR
jgi:hypothetical protein